MAPRISGWGARLHERAQNTKRPKVTPPKTQKLSGIRPLSLGKGPFHERNKSEKLFLLRFSSRLGVQLRSLHGGAGLHERACRTQKRPEVTLSKNLKLIGSRPLFLGKGPFHERNISGKFFFYLDLALGWGVQLQSLHPLRRHTCLSATVGFRFSGEYLLRVSSWEILFLMSM